MGRLGAWWSRLTGSLWFLPAVIITACALLATGLVWFDRVNRFGLAEAYPLVFGGGVEGSRGVLSAIASSVITVAGVVFSITIVALSLASSQYSPRVLRTFMADRPTQVVLGAFFGIFTYCILVLRTIGNVSTSDPFVPSIAVLTGIGLALLGVGLLVYFIHHVATSIQASSILERVTAEAIHVIDRNYPDRLEGSEQRDPRSNDDASGWHEIVTQRTGYIQGIAFGDLAEFASDRDLLLRIECAVGRFVVEGDVLLRANKPLDKEAAHHTRQRFSIGAQRTADQDVAFVIQEIVDVALKALSPGINDTTTALMCLDRLAAVLQRLTSRRLLPRLDEQGFERLIVTQAPDFASMLACAFDAVRRSGAGNPDVLLHLVRTGRELLPLTPNLSRRQLIGRHLRATLECAQRTIEAEAEREVVMGEAQRSLALLETSRATALVTALGISRPRGDA